MEKVKKSQDYRKIEKMSANIPYEDGKVIKPRVTDLEKNSYKL